MLQRLLRQLCLSQPAAGILQCRQGLDSQQWLSFDVMRSLIMSAMAAQDVSRSSAPANLLASFQHSSVIFFGNFAFLIQQLASCRTSLLQKCSTIESMHIVTHVLALLLYAVQGSL